MQVILFSDILTPLTGMNIPFDILKSKGPIIHNPIRTVADVAQVRELIPAEAVPYVGQALTALRSEVRLTFFTVIHSCTWGLYKKCNLWNSNESHFNFVLEFIRQDLCN